MADVGVLEDEVVIWYRWGETLSNNRLFLLWNQLHNAIYLLTPTTAEQEDVRSFNRDSPDQAEGSSSAHSLPCSLLFYLEWRNIWFKFPSERQRRWHSAIVGLEKQQASSPMHCYAETNAPRRQPLARRYWGDICWFLSATKCHARCGRLR